MTSIYVPGELMAASWSKCSSTCSCREKLSRHTNEHMGQSKLFSPRTQTENKSQLYVSDRNRRGRSWKNRLKKLNWDNTRAPTQEVEDNS